jgi:epoxide hydrolase-like predicted phosphatase
VTTPAPTLRGLLVDWGGVLTTALETSMARWADAVDIDIATFRSVMREWLGEDEAEIARVNPIHALERGEIEVPHFEEQLATRLRTRGGHPVAPAGLLGRMFGYFEHAPDMAGLVRRARVAGIRTALLSNSWGNTYPREGWDEMFDAVVISGEVGMRKPDAAIFLHTARLLDLEPAECVFVDDLPSNVAGAVALGMVGVRHGSYDQTALELEALFGVHLRD